LTRSDRGTARSRAGGGDGGGASGAGAGAGSGSCADAAAGNPSHSAVSSEAVKMTDLIRNLLNGSPSNGLASTGSHDCSNLFVNSNVERPGTVI
jgi:hypothetical protein